jgi:Protein of unknown function (DUF3429)
VKQNDGVLNTLSPMALALGCTGVLPFAFAALGLYLGYYQSFALDLFLYYGAVILSFLGGIRWAQALNGQLDALDFVLSIMPSLLACLSLLLPSRFGLASLALGFIAVAYLDLVLRPLVAPKGFLKLRLGLSIAVISLHFAVLAMVWR